MASSPLALLTGANGFVGAHVLSQLLGAGYRVRAAIRSEGKAAFIRQKYASQTAGANPALSFTIVPDIAAPHALDAAVAGTDFVVHLASPYTYAVSDPMAELIRPAVDMTRNVLQSALAHGSPTLRRVVILSSFASVVDAAKSPRPGYVYTEADWNPVTEADIAKSVVVAYSASKKFAEKAAWDFVEERKPAWDLVALNPPMIYGPPLHEVDASKGVDGLNTSLTVFSKGLTGQNPEFAPKVATPHLAAWVDVRDVAKAHVAALAVPRGKTGRFLLCGGIDNFEDGLAGLRAKDEKGLGEPGEKRNRADYFSLDTSKAREVLGIDFNGIEKTTEDTWASLKELGLVGV